MEALVYVLAAHFRIDNSPHLYYVPTQALSTVLTDFCNDWALRADVEVLPDGVQVVSGPYDAVVIAAPLEHNRLRFHGVHVRRPAMRSFRRVVTTFIAGRLRGSYFGTTQLPTGGWGPSRPT